MPARNVYYHNENEGSGTTYSSPGPEDDSAQMTRNASGKTPVSSETVTTEKKERVLTLFGRGMFSAGQDVMNEELTNSVKELVRDIEEFPYYRVTINGHTDNIPVKPDSGKRYIDNMKLSLLRAEAVSQILVDNGIPIERISVKGYGDTRPIASNDTEEGRALNRRVEIELVPTDREM